MIDSLIQISSQEYSKDVSGVRFLITKEDKSKELYSGTISGLKIFFIKPLTFMNLSGKPIFETVN